MSASAKLKHIDPWPTQPCRGVCCGEHLKFWRSIHGAVNCETCHPPADEALVVERKALDKSPLT